MAKFLANENVPRDAVEAARRAGVDIAWVRDISPGISDEAVLTLSQAEGRVLLTFDKDFGENGLRTRKDGHAWRHPAAAAAPFSRLPGPVHYRSSFATHRLGE